MVSLVMVIAVEELEVVRMVIYAPCETLHHWLPEGNERGLLVPLEVTVLARRVVKHEYSLQSYEGPEIVALLDAFQTRHS